MTKRISAVFAAILMITFMCSCGSHKTEHGIYSDIFKIYNSMESYTAEGTVTVVSNLTDNSYSFKQYYAAPGKYRIDLAGMSYIYSDGSVYLKASDNVQSLENYVAVDRNYIFVTDFFNEYFKNQEAGSALSGGAEDGFTVLNIPASGGTYRASQSMWLDNKTCLPSRIETFDVNKKPVLTVEFSGFKLNEKIDAGVFEIN